MTHHYHPVECGALTLTPIEVTILVRALEMYATDLDRAHYVAFPEREGWNLEEEPIVDNLMQRLKEGVTDAAHD